MEYKFLMREDAPFGDEVWQALDAAVVAAAKRVLVGRRFLPFTGPLGPGYQVIPVDGLKDFRLTWRDIETWRQVGAALDMGVVHAAAEACARLEDRLVFNGADEVGLPGLLTTHGRLTVKGGDLKRPGAPLKAVSQAIAQLMAAGSLEPYALVLTPELHTYLFSIHPETGRLEFDLVCERCQAGVFQSSALPPGKGVVVSALPHQLDLVVGLDMATGYIGPEKMNHLFRVMETAALRIRKPSAVCVIE